MPTCPAPPDDNLFSAAVQVMAATTVDRRAQRAGWYWPLFIVALLLLPVVFGGWLAWEATHDPTLSIEKDYYKKAIAWDAQMAQQRASGELGWQTTVAAGPPIQVGGSAPVSVQLRDRTGKPVDGAKVTVQLLHNRDPQHPLRAGLLQESAGLYRADVVFKNAGWYQLDGTATLGSEVFSWTERVQWSPVGLLSAAAP